MRLVHRMKSTIPNKLHYCWFGGGEMPAAYAAYMQSWHRLLPGHELIRWDESNFDLTCCAYVREAYAQGCWAFVSDYARFKVLYEHGGLYFDTDVELVGDLTPILRRGPFMALQPSLWGGVAAAPGLGLGFPAGHPLVKLILDAYEQRHFCINGQPDTQTTVGDFVTALLRSRGLRCAANTEQVIDGVVIYPTDVFCPIDCYAMREARTPRTVAVHHFSFSWATPSAKARSLRLSRLIAICGRRLGPRLWYISLAPQLIVSKLRRLSCRKGA